MRLIKLGLCLFALSLIGLVTACNDDDCPTCPDPQTPSTPTPTLANIWPHEDGNAWTYDLATSLFDVPFPVDPEDPPPLPSLEDLHADLQVPVEGDLLGSAEGLFRLAFDGLKTTDSGVTAQSLTETVYTDPWGKLGMGVEDPAAGRGSAVTAEGFELLLQRIAQARPDLRAKIAERYGVVSGRTDGPDKSEVPTFPFFLFGYAWSQEEAGIFSYGDLDTEHSWIYLESDLSVGHTFQMQLVPMLADNIWLYGEIWSRGTFSAGGIQYENCVESMYAVDFGVQEATDENGNLIASFRSWSYGVIVYAPTVGPIFSHERSLIGPNMETPDDRGTLEENISDLVGATSGE